MRNWILRTSNLASNLASDLASNLASNLVVQVLAGSAEASILDSGDFGR